MYKILSCCIVIVSSTLTIQANDPYDLQALEEGTLHNGISSAIPQKNPAPDKFLSDESDLKEQVDSFFAGEYSAAVLAEILETNRQGNCLSWYKNFSLKKTINWCTGAVRRLWDSAGKQVVVSIGAGAFFIGLGALCINTINHSDPRAFYELAQLHPGALLSSIPTNMAKWSFITLCHEAGHALVYYLSTGRIPSLYLGQARRSEVLSSLEILPHLHLADLNPLGNGHLENVRFIRPLEEIAIKKEVLMSLAEANPTRSLAKLKASPLFKRKVKQALKEKYGTHIPTIFYAAGPIAGIAGSALLKGINGSSLTELNFKDIENLGNFLPLEGHDGKKLISEGLGKPELAEELNAKCSRWALPLGLSLGIGYVTKTLYEWGIFKKMPSTSAEKATVFGNILRALGASIINFGAAGFINIEPSTT